MCAIACVYLGLYVYTLCMFTFVFQDSDSFGAALNI